jgi:hypothetical protein
LGQTKPFGADNVRSKINRGLNRSLQIQCENILRVQVTLSRRVKPGDVLDSFEAPLNNCHLRLNDIAVNHKSGRLRWIVRSAFVPF